ncbi:hypothetical protein ABIE27_004222 [Paenibacillus sp. 4624]|jgi:hypothetical protein|uniref:Uncharacterized protein n=1 Tax=Paenibacillus amylolyticus TaxID=1451 RepID=A0A5M9WUF7_PAEAM|nr:hypothetical protein [Paenibacillus amylolyticus]KAA8785053.1 hypothetical protein EC604_14510 [Paenibacillus amylolyticus]
MEIQVNDLNAYHYFDEQYGPLASLCSLPEDQAIKIEHKGLTTESDRIRYLKERKICENIMFRSLVKKGGKPEINYALYFTIGEQRVVGDLYSTHMVIPVRDFDPKTISFTYTDSFHTYSRIDNHPTRRKLYTIEEINHVISNYGFHSNLNGEGSLYKFIEMQVWSLQAMKNAMKKNKYI